uniref:Uncharacterized protein LOC104266817 n=1 Tax=Phallusia mammillata TaxID=59560 RepID=A0A6F9DIE8_9ASCI|nr:uncharacterized protein LOC104266817 [Phallusia mammillata]
MKANNFLATDIFPTDDMTISSEACREGLDTMVKMDYINKSEANVIQKYFYDKGSPMSLFKALNLVTKRTKRQSSAVSAISEEKQESEEIPESPVYRKSKDQKQLRLLEYEMAVQLCEEQGIVLSETLLRKALLIPDDLPRSTKIRTKLRQPGECLQSDFWKAQHKSTLRRRKRKTSPTTTSEGLSSGRRTPSDVNLITFPRLRDVAPER